MSDALLREFMIDLHEQLLAAIEERDPDRAERVQAHTIRKIRAASAPSAIRIPNSWVR